MSTAMHDNKLLCTLFKVLPVQINKKNEKVKTNY